MTGSIQYEASEPIINEGVYKHDYFIEFTDLYGLEDTDENIILHAKLLYCLKQVLDFGYFPVGNSLDISTKEIISGDVNLDETVDLYDVIWIGSHLINKFKLTERQQTVGDVNNDGVCDLYDAIEIAKKIM